MAVATLCERNCGGLHNADRQEYRVLELKLSLRPPFPESLERLAQEFSVLKTR
jgi:hypothetical protein